jgi:hypothetical protein
MSNADADLVAAQQILQRIAPPNQQLLDQLGLLAEFDGTWVGTGFNVIARPNRQQGGIFFLQLNSTIETLELSPVGGEIPNRGSQQGDIFLHGLHYLQRVSDFATHAPLHLEPGLWVHVPATTAPPQAQTYVRMGTIPHGDSIMAQSTLAKAFDGRPTFNPVDTLPFNIVQGAPIPGINQPNPPLQGVPLGYEDPYLNPRLPPGLPALPPGVTPATVVKNPVVLLEAATSGQDITRTVVIEVSSAGAGGVVNIPFVVKNADAIQVDAIFWIETVVAAGQRFQQLQYVQRVILDFDGIHWPHISIATLVKQ